MTPRASWLDFVRPPLGGISTPPLKWTSWSVVLQELLCVQLSDSKGRKPYIWPVLVWFDDFTKTTPVRVGVTGPLMQNVTVLSENPLSEDMHAGDTVAIREAAGNVGTYTFDASDTVDAAANQLGPNLVLVIALFEHHDFEEDVIEAGYTVFQSALQEAMAKNLADLVLFAGDNQNILKNINISVKAAVNSAINNALPDHLALAVGFTQDELIDSNSAQRWSGVNSTSDFRLLFTNSPDPTVPDPTATVYAVRGQLQVGTPPAPLGLPFDCASGGPFPAVNMGSFSGSGTAVKPEDGDVTVDKVDNGFTLDLTSQHGGITIAHKVDQHSSAALTACKGVSIAEKIDNHSHATIVARGDVAIRQKIDQHSTADINSESAIDIGQKIDQHSVAKLTAGTTVHIGQKIDQHSTAAIFAVGDINIDEGIDQHSTAYITSLDGSITIGQAVDGNSVVTLRAPNGNITIRQKVAGGATVNVTLSNFMCPDTSGGTVNPLQPFPPLP